ncbi:MAG: sodium pump decarboxylase [Lachnospiraceae bacterium]|nr:sodium pump decarboxylase [Lachnospiraceae bacterium]
MKKKIALFLSVLSVVMMLGACSAEDPTKVDYNGVTYEELKNQSTNSAAILKDFSEEKIEEQIAILEEQGEDSALALELCKKWLAAMEVSGKFVAMDKDSFVITKSGKTLTTDLMLEFEDRDVVFQLVYNYHNMELTGITIEPVYTFGEKMTKAALNTVICMSIVFVVLVFISLLISCFKIFPYLEAKKREKALKEFEANKVPEVAQQEDVFVPQVEDDTELVAVIAAAIAAYEGTSTSDFVVRSIRRR